MSQWPTMWRQNALTHAEITVSDHALRALALWNKSTPTDSWTLNPIGIPAHGYHAPRALNTPYAAFPTWQAFYQAFKVAMQGMRGTPLKEALAVTESLPAVWRAIQGLGWPGSVTEQDYPSALLDATGDDFKEAWSTAMGTSKAGTGRTHSAVPDSGIMKSLAAPSMRTLENFQAALRGMRM